MNWAYSNLNSLFELARRGNLQAEDVPQLPLQCHCADASKELMVQWNQHKQLSNATARQRRMFVRGARDKKVSSLPTSLISALWVQFRWDLVKCGSLFLLSALSYFASPYFLSKLVESVEKNEDPSVVSMNIALLVISRVLVSFSFTRYSYSSGVILTSMSAAIKGAIFHKTLRLSTESKRKFSPGVITNLCSIDVDRVVTVGSAINTLWALPLSISLGLVILYREVSLAMFGGLSAILIVFVLQNHLAQLQKKENDVLLKLKDQRMKLMAEFLNSVIFVKFNVWEDQISRQVLRCREVELHHIARVMSVNAVLVCFIWFAPNLVSVATVMSYADLMHSSITASKIFTALSVFRMLQAPLRDFPSFIAQLYQALSSVERLEEFYAATEVSENPRSTALDVGQLQFSCSLCFEWRPLLQPVGGTEVDDTVPGQSWIQMRQPMSLFGFGKKAGSMPSVAFRRLSTNDSEIELPSKCGESVVNPIAPKRDDFQLRFAENFTVERGALVVVEGMVGSGKSSLCSALLGEMYEVSQPQSDNAGKVPIGFQLNGSVAYATQQPWIQNMTLRNNILFGRPFDVSWYNQVVAACCLMADFDELPNGDATEIGEKGLNLSGGQKARVALARAVYGNPDIVILDDVLSALDATVAKHVFDLCIIGLLESKTRILVTNNPDVINHAAVNVLMHVDKGLVCCNKIHPLSKENNERKEVKSATMFSKSESLKWTKGSQPQDSTEHRATGKIDGTVYSGYFYAMGGWTIFLWLCFVQICWQCLSISADIFLANWSKQTDAAQADRLSYNMMVYSSLALGSGSIVFIRSGTLALAGFYAAKKIFQRLLAALLAAPMAWYDKNPSGRILNRVSDDLAQVDLRLPFIVGALFSSSFGLMGDLATSIFITKYMVVAVVPTMFVYLRVMQMYLSCSREIQRMKSVSQSPVLTLMTECSQGAHTVRSFGRDAMNRMEERNYELVNANSRMTYAYTATNAWFVLRIQLLGTFLLFCLCLVLFVFRNNLSAGLVGLCLSYGLGMTTRLQNIVTHVSLLENAMVCPERLFQYINIGAEGTEKQKEEAWDSSSGPRSRARSNDKNPPPLLLVSGKIEFRNVRFRYQRESELVLKDVSFTIPAGAKVGIVGRTGSGKSSLSMCLFRIAELAGGQVLIDGVDISNLTLKEVRGAVEIIPQMPVLLKGTVRHYLDPFDEYSTEGIWSALEKAQLLDVVTSLSRRRTTSEPRIGNGESVTIDVQPDKETVLLEARIEENGENLSVGERQLFVLSRALLRKAKILFMDEATASVDPITDAKIHSVLRDEFKMSTVVTIAHRIDTVLGCETILVMDSGQLVEIGSPDELARTPSSRFASLLHDSSSSSKAVLRR